MNLGFSLLNKKFRLPSKKGNLNLIKLASRLDVKFYWLDHVFRAKDSVEFFLSQDAMFKNEVVYTTTCFKSFLRNLSRVLVTDNRIQCSYNTDTVVNFISTSFFVSSDTFDTTSAQSIKTVSQQVD